MAKGITEEELEGRFAYLDQLRESGATNMFGAASYLISAFGLSSSDARQTLTSWMKTFGDGKLSPLQRAKLAFGFLEDALRKEVQL